MQSNSPLRLRIIPYAEIAADLVERRARMISWYGRTSRSERFSTAFHKTEEITPLVPETPIFNHEIPPLGPYMYTIWQPLIKRSQNLPESHIFRIPDFLFGELIKCHGRWITGRTDNADEELVEEITETWLSCKASAGLTELFRDDAGGARRWFFRLDDMSTKDSPYVDRSVRSVQDIVRRICTSMRAYNALNREWREAKKEGRDMQIKLVLNPWDEGIDTSFEWRIFVPPPAARGVEGAKLSDLRIAAVSQYRWPSPLVKPKGLGVRETVERVYQGAQGILGEIVEYSKGKLEEGIQDSLVRYGFVFDVFLRDGEKSELVELNPFGALSPCGGSLYNWAQDGRAMYGLDTEVEFIVTLEESDEGSCDSATI